MLTIGILSLSLANCTQKSDNATNNTHENSGSNPDDATGGMDGRMTVEDTTNPNP